MRPATLLRKPFLIALLLACATSSSISNPERFDIAYIEQSPHPIHLRFMSATGALSPQVFLPNGLEVYMTGHNSLAWSPDGRKLTFATTQSGNRDVYTINANGTGLKRITTNTASDMSPAWSPDGTRIAFLSNRNSTYLQDIYVIDLATSVETRLTPTSDFYQSLGWSPDNTRLAYSKNVNAAVGDEIFLLDINTGAVTQIGTLPGPAFAQGLQWNPAPSTLLFYVPGTYADVYTLPVSGSPLLNLTGSESSESSAHPSWYMSNQVLYVRYAAGAAGLYRMSATGSSSTMIGAVSSYPWSPVYRFATVDLPDLVVSSYSWALSTTDPAAPKRVVTFRVRNIGTAPSGPCLVYVNGNNPTPAAGINEIRMQASVQLLGLGIGAESGDLQISFDLAKIHAEQVKRVDILVDAKDMVTEAFEINNSASWIWP